MSSPTNIPTRSVSPTGTTPLASIGQVRRARFADTLIINTAPSVGDQEKNTPDEKALKPAGIDLVGEEGDHDSVGSLEDDYPDGGLRAWLIVLGSMCCTFSTFGFVNTWGVFQSYYENTILKGTSPSTIAWIGSVQYSLVFGPGIVAGRLLDLGHFRIPFIAGTIICVLSTLLVAQCSKYWQFLLCQGFAIGLGSGLCFGPTLGIVGHWFSKRRGLALGLTAVGSSIGGTVYPIAARELIPRVGFPWAMRIMAFMNLAALTISNLTMVPRLPPKNVPGGLLNLRILRSPVFSIYCTSCLIAFLGMYTVLTYIDTSAGQAGVSADFSFYLVSIANASSGLGRLMMGIAVDRFGAVNMIMPMSVVAAALTFAWPYASAQGEFVAIALLYGFATAAFVSAFGIPLYAMGDMGDVGRRLGTSMIFTGIGALCGPPISGAIIRTTGRFNECSYYAASVILISVAMQLLSKRLVLGRFTGKF